MVFLVDVRLKGSIFLVISSTLREAGVHRSSRSSALFTKVLSKATQNKLSKLPMEKLKGNVTLSSFDFFLEGQGAMEISSRPTDAQESIVKSLIKVILHQVNASGSYELSEGQENLLISLCVEKLQVETVCENTNLPCSEGSLTEKIEDIFAKVEPDGSDTSILKNTFHIRFYCCMDDQDLNTTTNNVMEEFDKIDIQDPSNRGEDDERTLTSTNPALMGLPISQETATQTEIQLLPSADYDGLWEALHFDCNIKQRLFSYATISLKLSQFSRKCVSEALVSNNKLLLVHGPPGTGKTTVCKALCQKLSIRHYQKNVKAFDIADYRAIIVEISCSRIFSRWFGESAKNLDSIFKDIEKLLIQNADQSKFVCLLMDEVETIASSRSSQMNKNETTDGVRVVNTLLTQLDNLKRYNNLLVLATSNLVESLDPAFVDRADGIFFIGTPSEEGTSIILSSTIRELIRAKVIVSKKGVDIVDEFAIKKSITSIACKCAGLQISGRTLRKLPLVCLSEYLPKLPVNIEEFLVALALSVREYRSPGHMLVTR